MKTALVVGDFYDAVATIILRDSSRIFSIVTYGSNDHTDRETPQTKALEQKNVRLRRGSDGSPTGHQPQSHAVG